MRTPHNRVRRIIAKYHLPEYEALGWAIIEIAHKR